MNILEKVKSELKENPNNFIIIKKWNKRIFQKYKFDIFNYIENTIEKRFKDKKAEDFTKNFVNIKDLNL
jgi:transposase